jgi:hypothetical protein
MRSAVCRNCIEDDGARISGEVGRTSELMAIDTLAYAKALEEAGVDRRTAEAHAEALTRHVLPDLVTKTDLERVEERLAVRIAGARADIIKWVFGAVGLQTPAILGGVAALIHLLK